MSLKVDSETSDAAICAACPDVYNSLFQPRVVLICKQKVTDPKQIIIKLVLSQDRYFELDQLSKMGYTEGPMESHEFYMSDYETLCLTFQRNIGCIIGNRELNGLEGENYKLTFRVRVNKTILSLIIKFD